jgi:ankyrin repeat protein
MVLDKYNFTSWKKTIEKKLNDLKESKRTYLKDNDEVVKHLIENGANVNVQNNEGYTPLYLSVILEHFKSAQLLLDAGADVNIKDNEEKSLQTTAIGSGHKTALEFLGRNNVC